MLLRWAKRPTDGEKADLLVFKIAQLQQAVQQLHEEQIVLEAALQRRRKEDRLHHATAFTTGVAPSFGGGPPGNPVQA